MGKRWWEKKNQDGKVFLSFAIILSTLMFVVGVSWIAWAAVQQENGVYGWSGTKWERLNTVSVADDELTGLISNGLYGFDGTNWDRLRTTTIGDNVATGLIATGLYGFDGVTWDMLRTSSADDSTTGILATGLRGYDGANWDLLRTNQVGQAAVASTTTFLGTTIYGWRSGNSQWWAIDAVKSWTGSETIDSPGSGASLSTVSLNANNTGVDFIYAQDVTEGDNLTQGLPATGLYGYDGTNWDRARIDSTGSLYVNTTSNATSAITTNTTTAVKATGGKMMKVITRADNPGATSTIRFYDIATAGCSGTPASGDTAILLDTTTDNTIYDINHQFTNGICAVTAGGTAAYVTVTYR